jgi:predicted RNA binding protein YcfA (HicA-like mRNA interferase family)
MRSQESRWPATKATSVLAALNRIGWRVKRQKGSHRTLTRPGWQNYVFAYHDKAELGPVALKVLGQKTGLTPDDL